MNQASGLRRGQSDPQPVLYIAPWIDLGGTDSGTIDWFRWIDPGRYRASMVTTQPSANRRLGEVVPHAVETWPLPDLIPGPAFPDFILDFIHTRGVRVVHLMNSRLGFDLVPDIRALPDPPAIVAQLHVEEPDRRGYVRYASTRYGNLIDAFSVVGTHLSEALQRDYEVPAAKCHVIPLGVDCKRFAPGAANAVALDRGVTQIVFAGRLSEQKDPLLMLNVAEGLKQAGSRSQVHCLGDGPLERAVSEEVRRRGLEDRVLLHGFVGDLAPWYAAADMVLMTSLFEGVPCVVYEAMAAGLPVVAPALPGLREVLADSDLLVEQREDISGYVAAITRLASDPDLRAAVGGAARARCLQHYSAEASAAAHMALYDTLTAGRPGPSQGDERPPASEPIRLSGTRSSGEPPLVSVVVPCHNHGRWLKECLDSVRTQSYPHLELIIVDDASDDRDTVAYLQGLADDPSLVLIRLAERGGPSRARNEAIGLARGRYVLPLDSDNVLLPEAVELMVKQLREAGPDVGFIYPNQQYFGNRDDYAVAPSFNLYNLTLRNFCDTSSLIDADVFRAGVRYVEDVELIHEDWDFVLQLAARAIHGLPAAEKTLMVRKWGYTRSDQVEHLDESLSLIEARNAQLYRNAESIKAEWAPALSIIPLETCASPEQRGVWAPLRQTCRDAEILAPPAGAKADRAIAEAVRHARGRFLMLIEGTGMELLGDPASVEKVLRILVQEPQTGAVALVEGPSPHGYPFRRLSAPEAQERRPIALAWSVHWAENRPQLQVREGDRLSDVCQAIMTAIPLQWREVPGIAPERRWVASAAWELSLTGGGDATPAAVKEREIRLQHPPLLPAIPRDVPRRWAAGEAWMPPLTIPLCRHISASGDRVITNTERHLPGYILEHRLGSINMHRLPGTVQLIKTREEFRVSDTTRSSGGDEVALGFLEDSRSPLPMLDPVFAAHDLATGAPTLVGADDDPLRAGVEVGACLGLIEPFPIRPRPRALADAASREEFFATQVRQVVVAQKQEIDALWRRIEGIHNSTPARIYRRLSWMPGLKRALLGRSPRDGT